MESSTRDRESIVDRIRKILLKTEQAGCTPAESERAFAMASRIMAEHNLDMAEIDRPDKGEQSWIDDDVMSTGQWRLEDNLAYGIVRRHFFVEGFFGWTYTNDGRRRKLLRFFGRQDNVATAKWAFVALTEAFDRLFAEYRKRTGCPAGERRLFVSGVADGFSRKMRDEARAMEVERDLMGGNASGSTALALVAIKDQTVAAYKAHHANFFKQNGKAKGGRGNFTPVSGSHSSFEAGQAAGRSLTLNRAVGGESRRKGLPS